MKEISVQSNELRVSDAERNRAVALLAKACADGRLSLDEYSERVNQALSARTRGDLSLVIRDLPLTTPMVAQTRTPRWTIALLGEFKRNDHWRVGEETNALAIMGSCTLDLRRAVIQGSEVLINAHTVMGSVKIIVPKGTQVELGGLTIMGSKQCKLPDSDVLPGSPIIRVEGVVFCGSVDIVTG